MDINQLLQFYADQGISSRPQPINQGIAAVDYTAPIMPKIIEDQGSSSDEIIDSTKQGVGSYSGMPIRFRDIVSLFMNPIYGVPNLMARSANYTSPLDFAKQKLGYSPSVVDPGVAVPTTGTGQMINPQDLVSITDSSGQDTGFNEYSSPGVAASYEGSS